MRLKDILVSLDPTRAGLKRLEVAARLAQRHGAEVIGFYGAPTSGYFTRCGDGIEAVAGTDVGENTLSAGEIAEEMRTRFEEVLATTASRALGYSAGKRCSTTSSGGSEPLISRWLGWAIRKPPTPGHRVFAQKI